MASVQEDFLFLSLAEKISEEPYDIEDSFSVICQDANCTLHNHQPKAVIRTVAQINANSNVNLNASFKASYKNADARSLKRGNSARTTILYTTDSSNSHFDYKSGAVYEGKVRDNLKSGNGTFLWPNGDKYIGEFKDNYRHGLGINFSFLQDF